MPRPRRVRALAGKAHGVTDPVVILGASDDDEPSRGCSVNPAHEELARRLSALQTEFADLGRRSAEAARGLAAASPPPAALLDQLKKARQGFAQLRTAVLAHAGELQPAPDPDRLRGLRDLEPILQAVVEMEALRARKAAWEEARQNATKLLDVVLALVHEDDHAFAALAGCQDKARELRAGIAALVPDDLERETRTLAARVAPYGDLLALVEGWNVLDDDRCALLQDAIAQAFGRTLALAALRGKLTFRGIPKPPAIATAAAAREAEATAVSPASPAIQPPAVPAPPAAPVATTTTPRVEAPLPPVIPPPLPTLPLVEVPVAVTAPRPAPPPPPAAAPPPPRAETDASALPPPLMPPLPEAPPSTASIVEQIRRSGEQAGAETPEARREREQTLERLAAARAKWWVGARTGWTALHRRNQSLVEAARDVLARFPHLLSVPIQDSAAGEHGLAEGYGLLLEHVERQAPGFVAEALSRLNPQLTAGALDRSYPIGQELYLYLVAEGRLYKTYPDFVKEILAAVVPKPGVWTLGGIVESNDSTVVFRRLADRPGAGEKDTAKLTADRERFREHVFAGTLAPLTTAVFYLEAGDLELTRNVTVHLKEDGDPSDRAWLLVQAVRGGKPEIRRQKVLGTTLAELGKDFAGLWVAVFNTEPNADKRYELTIELRRKVLPVGAGKPAGKTWPFGPRRRG